MPDIPQLLKQKELDFSTNSPINQEKLGGQNKVVYDWLAAGNSINCYEAQDVGITALNSRISNLRNLHNVSIADKFETTKGGSKVKRYFFPQYNPFKNQS